MALFLVIIHVVVCVALIMIVLLQTGKGADMGAAFGGGSSQTLFGSTGASTFLSKLTTVAAVVFMVTSLSLAYRSGQKQESSIMPETSPPIEQPAATQSSEPGTAAPEAKEADEAATQPATPPTAEPFEKTTEAETDSTK
jgi:preprotein translocase subunit SecG